MASADEVKAINIRMANDINRTAEDYGWQKLPATLASQNIALPREFAGRWIMIYVPTGGTDVHVAASLRTTSTIDTTVAASTTFPTTKVGTPCLAGAVTHVRAPYTDVPDQLRLVFASSGNQTFFVGLGDTV